MSNDEFAMLDNAITKAKRTGDKIVFMDKQNKSVRVLESVENWHAGYPISEFKAITTIESFLK